MSEPVRISEEAREAAALAIHCRLSVGSPSSWIGGVHPPSTDELAAVALEAALPHLACSCFVISDVNDYCPQHGRDS